METIAVYWEPIIRTYGFQVQQGLLWHPLRIPLCLLGAWARRLQEMDVADMAFRMVWAQVEDSDHLKVTLVCEAGDWERVRRHWRSPEGGDDNGRIASGMPVDLVFFHGPHFGDRYGIMDFTYKALAREKVPLVAAVCSAATIYLVLPAGMGPDTRTLLSGAFEIPTTVPGARRNKASADGDGRS
ncbi:MAG: hypothetical protein KFF50_10560 [Desulfatitalea sp.]|nr:hypothetical protein [Desulfatitalea sp.]